MNRLIETLREERNSLRAALTEITDKAATENRDLDDTENKNFEDLVARAEANAKRLEQLEQIELRTAAGYELSTKVDAAAGKVRVENIKEADIYRAGGEFDFLKDVVAVQLSGDFAARERLARHDAHMRSGVTTADMAGLIPPTYLTDLYAPLAHEGRPFANVCNRSRALVGNTAYITKAVNGSDVDAQSAENATLASSEPDMTDVQISAKTYAGTITVSRQALHFGSVTSETLTADLARKYGQKLDNAIINSTGLSGTHEGVLNIEGYNPINGAVITGSTDRDKFGKLWQVVGAAKTAVRKSFTGNADILVINSDLWGWINGVTDSEGRPLMGYGFSAPTNVAGSGDNFTFNGLRVVIDDNLTTELNGSDTLKNFAIVANSRELWLFEENGGVPQQFELQNITAHNVTIAAVGYSAFYAERYPTAVSIISDIPVGV
jgi:HK97 family phage major capsid protein